MNSLLPKWIVPYLARHKRQIAMAVGLGVIAAGCAALLMFTSGYLISATALPSTTLFSVMVPVAFVQLFGFGRPLARYLERLASHDWVLRVTSDLRLALFKSLDEHFSDPGRLHSAGEYLELLSEDVAHLQNLYLRIALPAAIAYAVAIGACIAFGAFSPVFALIMAGCFALVALVLPKLAAIMTRHARESAIAARSDTYVKLSDDVSGSTDWALSGRNAEAIGQTAKRDSAKREADARVRMRSRSFSLASHVTLGILACLVVLWAGSRFGASPEHVNWIAAFVLGFFPLVDILGAIPQSIVEMSAHKKALERLGEFACDDVSPMPDSGQARASSPHIGQSQPDMPAGIAISGLSFTYPGAKQPVFKDFSLTVPQGQKIALLGKSGSGKTTLADLISATFAPDCGEVLIAGRNVAEDRADAARLVGYLGQSPHLFNRTLRDNLDLNKTGKTDDELIGALRSVGLGAKFDSLQRGLDTVVGETGIGFSGGEAHRIALARVMLADTPIVLVDEPFNALDPETEHDLLGLLLDQCANRTLIVITHHLAEIERFDRVVFLEKGNIVIDGAPEELSTANGKFKALLAFDR